nr:MAG TPA: hypothetical protein [Caudoviricetes sp.]
MLCSLNKNTLGYSRIEVFLLYILRYSRILKN